MTLPQMSLSGGIFILTVIIIRAAAINKLPKMTFLTLWYVALLRLLLPVTFPFPMDIYSTLRKYIPVLDILEGSFADFAAGSLLNQPDSAENGAIQTIQTVWPIQTAQPSQAVQTIQNTQSYPQQMSGTPSFSVILIIWAVGMAVMAGFFIVQYLRCRREFQTALPVQNDFAALWRREHPLRRALEIRQLTGLSTPLTYGVFHPVILLPKNTDWQNERQMRYILFHEYVHIRRFDAVGKLIASAALCVHWFNPLVWALCILFHRDIELSCDEYVIRHFGRKNRKEYAMTLLRMEEQRNHPTPFGSYFSKNTTEERIKAIMKFKKKPVFALALAVILTTAGAVMIFAAVPKTDNTDLGDILRGDAPFFHVSETALEPVSLDDVPTLFDPHDTYMKIWDFAVQDLDGDKQAEVILTVFGMAGDMGGHLILHPADGKVYGHTVDYRSLTDLKADGTYSYSDPTGAVEGGICSITSFTETGYICDKITYGRGGMGEWDTFVVNRQPATEEEYLAAWQTQAQKQDAAWYEFTAENINTEFP